MTPEEAGQVSFDPFDVTKVWPRGQFPMQEVGVVELNRNPEDYHRDVEQAAFSPGSLVPGIELSPDTLLQWRAFFYRDAQLHRLQSANIHQIPVNCPCKILLSLPHDQLTCSLVKVPLARQLLGIHEGRRRRSSKADLCELTLSSTPSPRLMNSFRTATNP